jgi:sulfate adenylyltransferase subunit 2
LQEKIDMPCLYFSHRREVVERNGMLLAKSEYIQLQKGEKYEEMQIRFRTIGDMVCTGAILSDAVTLEEIVNEVAATKVTERGNRADDKRSEAAMEDRKKEGYF